MIILTNLDDAGIFYQNAVHYQHIEYHDTLLDEGNVVSDPAAKLIIIIQFESALLNFICRNLEKYSNSDKILMR